MINISARLERFVIAGVVLAMNAGALVIMSFFEVPEVNHDVVIQLVGGINTLSGLIIGRYFQKPIPEKVDAD